MGRVNIGFKLAGPKYAVMALSGVNGGWHRKKEAVMLPDGSREKRPHGSPQLIPDLHKVSWTRRLIYLVFDSDVGTAKHASLFVESPRKGAMGAEYTLAQLLRAQGARVRIVCIPQTGQEKVGADDYIASRGASEFYELMCYGWVYERDLRMIFNERLASDTIEKLEREAINKESSSTKLAGKTSVVEEVIRRGTDTPWLGL